MSKSIKEMIIQHLSSGNFVSGEQLGEELEITRAAVGKHIENFADMGLDIYRVTGKGYKLAQPIKLLDVNTIKQIIESNITSPKIEVHQIIDSTNSYLLGLIPNNISKNQICIAEYQSNGRGRRGRQWISPFGSHLYLSMYRYLEEGMSAAMGLSVVAALAVHDTIKQLFDVDVGLKWPNDIYLNEKKLAGILIDLDGQPMEVCHSVIGIGINLSMPKKSAEQVDQPWSDLASVLSRSIDRNEIAATLIERLLFRLEQHKKSGLENMLDRWHQHDIYYNKPIRIITGQNEVHGISRGINAQGALLIEKDQTITPIYGGEVSLRGRE